MNILRIKELGAAIVLMAVVAGVGRAQTPPIFVDKFEAGTAGTAVGSAGTVWGKNDITVTLYQTATNPFPGSTVYADLNDPQNSAAPSVAVRLMSNGNNSTNPLIAGQVTTFSFDFFEPTRTGDAGVVIAGYYREQANVDLNTAGRNYTATLHDGTLGPQLLLAGSGAATTYALDTVNTLFIMANDSAAAVVDYIPTHTLAPATADVWISKAGAAPEYFFSVNRGNAVDPNNTPVVGVGFRTVNADIEQVLVDNVLVIGGASLDRSALNAAPTQIGDFNGDKKVDGADFLLWQSTLGATVGGGTAADGSGNGTVDAADLELWKSHFGQSSGVASVPEPGAIALLVPIFGIIVRRRGKRSR